jgi:hypothetical protein
MPRPVQSEQPAEREFSAGMGRPQREARFNFQARPLAEDPGDGRSGGVSQSLRLRARHESLAFSDPDTSKQKLKPDDNAVPVLLLHCSSRRMFPVTTH